MNENLLEIAGSFAGVGVNHDQEEFTGRMTLLPHLGRRGASLAFTAVGANDEVYHDERTLVGFNAQGELCLVSTSNNTGGLLHYRLADRADSRWIFQFGDVADKTAFRETRELRVHQNGDVTYRFSWGLPGGPFQERSVVRMSRVSEQA